MLENQCLAAVNDLLLEQLQILKKSLRNKIRKLRMLRNGSKQSET